MRKFALSVISQSDSLSLVFLWTVNVGHIEKIKSLWFYMFKGYKHKP